VDQTEQQKTGETRQRIHAALGQIVLALASTPRYRQLPFSDLQALVLDPLLRDRVALATAKSEDGKPMPGATAGIAFWASVSPEVDAKIREQIAANVFPVRLKADEWASGQQVWLFDILAQNPQTASFVLSNFKSVAKSDQVRLHPMVTRQVDPEMLKQMNVVKL
jgi:cytolysin-activating lysine-acyltransferase